MMALTDRDRNLAEAHLAHEDSTLVSIPVGSGTTTVPAYLHAPRTALAGVLLVSGVGGGVSGPTGMYVSLATRLAREGIATLRLDYRVPGNTPQCAADMAASIQLLQDRYAVDKFAMVGWSFGSAPVFTLADRMRDAHLIKAIAVVAPQMADAMGIGNVPPVPVLFVHGEDDQCLPPMCSKLLKRTYDTSLAFQTHGGRCDVVLMPDDDHCLTHTYRAAETRILDFLLDALVPARHAKHSVASLVPSDTVGIELMRKGHDLDTVPGGNEHESINDRTRAARAEGSV
ncbi:hypothetical protein GGF31_008797 [Allomyces arbusculus]|nr:hypothetical protein GGF31_008797 [Allomyces arbusculus]